MPQQARWWAAGYLILIALFALCAVISRGAHAHPSKPVRLVTPRSSAERRSGTEAGVAWRTRLHWGFAAAVPSALLLGVTRHLTTDIASIPLLWVGPLALYLLSYVVAFGRWGVGATEVASRALRILAVAIVVTMGPLNLPLLAQLAPHLLCFFAASVLAHGVLARSRPAAVHLTEFYLWLSIGGVVGGALTSLVAPLVFPVVLEYPIAIVLALTLVIAGAGTNVSRRPSLLFAAAFGVVVMAITLAALAGASLQAITIATGATALLAYALAKTPKTYAVCMLAVLVPATASQTAGELARVRTFFGVYNVTIEDGVHTLHSGTTIHGAQSFPGGVADLTPLTYYAYDQGVGKMFETFDEQAPPRQVGIIGLGAGALASYGRAGDTFDFYEIDGGVVDLARDPKLFTYLSDSPARITTVVGDGRLELERYAGTYDVVVLDAFSSDAIPVHLLTAEAFSLYRAKLTDDGVLAVHISNRFFDFAPVVAGLAESANLYGRIYNSGASTWVVMSTDERQVSRLGPEWSPLPDPHDRLWTDEFSDLLGALR